MDKRPKERILFEQIQYLVQTIEHELIPEPRECPVDDSGEPNPSRNLRDHDQGQDPYSQEE
jgi:hypothetical protein